VPSILGADRRAIGGRIDELRRQIYGESVAAPEPLADDAVTP